MSIIPGWHPALSLATPLLILLDRAGPESSQQSAWIHVQRVNLACMHSREGVLMCRNLPLQAADARAAGRAARHPRLVGAGRAPDTAGHQPRQLHPLAG